MIASKEKEQVRGAMNSPSAWTGDNLKLSAPPQVKPGEKNP